MKLGKLLHTIGMSESERKLNKKQRLYHLVMALSVMWVGLVLVLVWSLIEELNVVEMSETTFIAGLAVVFGVAFVLAAGVITLIHAKTKKLNKKYGVYRIRFFEKAIAIENDLSRAHLFVYPVGDNLNVLHNNNKKSLQMASKESFVLHFSPDFNGSETIRTRKNRKRTFKITENQVRDFDEVAAWFNRVQSGVLDVKSSEEMPWDVAQLWKEMVEEKEKRTGVDKHFEKWMLLITTTFVVVLVATLLIVALLAQ